MEATSKPTDARNLLLVGFVILLVGAASLISELWPTLDRYLPLLVGVGLLAVFWASRAYLALVAGAILTGLGTGLLVAGFLPGNEVDGAGAVLGLAGGFMAVWTVSRILELREHHWWPLVPGSILLAVGSGLALDLIAGDASALIVPAALVVLGALMMAVAYRGKRAWTRPRIAKET
jgi:hypothetical protein